MSTPWPDIAVAAGAAFAAEAAAMPSVGRFLKSRRRARSRRRYQEHLSQVEADVMLRQNRALVAEETAAAILESQLAAGPAADPLQRARDEQARMDAATARRTGQRK